MLLSENMPAALFDLRPSRYLYKLIFILYSLFIFSLVFSDVSHNILILFVLSCLISFYWIEQQQNYGKKIIWDQKSAWNIYTKNSQIYHIDILPNTFCSRYLIILNFSVSIKEAIKKDKNKIKKKSLVILPDSMIKQDFKRLRIYLLNSGK